MKRNRITKFGILAGALVAVMLAAGCTALDQGGTGTETGTGSSVLPLVVFLVLIFAFMYFGVIRPQRRRQKEHQHMVEALKKGDKVITAGGIYGVIESMSDTSIVIKVESGQTLRVAKGSVALRREG